MAEIEPKATGADQREREPLWLDIFFALLTAAYAVLFVRQPSPFFADDSFFYLQVGRNFALGYGSTFNRLMQTNGYHPIWMLLCAAVYRVFPESYCRPAHDCGVDCAAEYCGAGGGGAIAASSAGTGLGGVDDSDSVSVWPAAGNGVFSQRGHAGGNTAGAVQIFPASGLEERIRV